MHTINVWVLFCCLSLGVASAHAEGMMPRKDVPKASSATFTNPLLIGQGVPESVLVQDSSGTVRSLMSYKSASEIMVVSLFSNHCATDAKLLYDWQRLYNAYKDWKVSFVAVDADGEALDAALSAQLQKAGLPIPVLHDPKTGLLKFLNVSATPAVLVLDESGVLRYRGPLNSCYDHPDKRPCRKYAENAMDAVIGHVESVPVVEPPIEGGCPVTGMESAPQ